uniref:Uncharacterized protein n=1 Tax=Caenorhabditis japonica TaxID=281687 RepID=A0A8R1IMQ6_CAEJA
VPACRDSIRCVEFQNQAVTKNIVPFKEFIYVHYTVHNNMFTVPDPKSRKRRLEDHEIFQLKNFVLPNRSVVGAKRFAETQGIEVTTKQVSGIFYFLLLFKKNVTLLVRVVF